ncbi:MAG: zinc/manganese transport system permease protein [Lentimonas sp.]|jgi:zinc/manganese transport system permease protein
MPNLELLTIITPALIAGLVISVTHGLLGIKVLQRGIIFIDIAIAQIASLGLVVAHLFFDDSEHLVVQSITLFAAILASWFFYFIEKKIPAQQEAIVGCSFILAASTINLLFAGHAGGAEEIKNLLSG